MSSKNIEVKFTVGKSLNKISFMNNMATVLQVLHSDPTVKSVDFLMIKGPKTTTYSFKLT